jgi:hypothetical protein
LAAREPEVIERIHMPLIVDEVVGGFALGDGSLIMALANLPIPEAAKM